MAEDDSTEGAQVAVVTVSFHSGDVLSTMLSSLPEASRRRLTVVVADNAVDEEARRLATRHGAAYLRVEGNPGYGTAVNRAVAALPDAIEWVIVTNPDVEFSAGSIDELIDVVGDDPDVAAAGPMILNTDGTVYPSARRLPSLLEGGGHAVFARMWPGNPWTRAYRNEGASGADRDAGWLSGSCFAIRRSAFTSVGGFDESYFMYFEDVDLGRRLGSAGFRLRYVTSATVVHLGGTSTAAAAADMTAEHHRSARRYLDARYRGPALLPLRWMLHVALGLRARAARRDTRSRGSRPEMPRR